MIYRIILLVCCAAILTSLTVSGWLYYDERTSEEPGLVVEEPELEFNHLVVGQEFDINFRLRNRTQRTLRVVGIPEKV